MKKILTLIILIINSIAFAQTQEQKNMLNDFEKFDSKSKEQVLGELEKMGMTLEDAEKLAKIQGIDINDFLSNFSKEDKDESIIDEQPKIIQPKLNTDNDESIDDKKSKRFGAYFFNNSNISETPNLYLATPEDYRLGPGDQLIVNLFGALENTYSLEVSREGNIKFDRIPPVYISGLSMNQAKKRIKLNLSKIYSGLYSSDNIDKVDLDISLLKARSISVNIIGNVVAPGTYTISGFSSVLNALYLAGGPNEVGTYRDVKIIRSNTVSKNVDLYEYFNKGLYPSYYLRDQDVIFVGTLKKSVNVLEGFRINGVFELKENETYFDIINLSGGISSGAYKEKIFVESNDGIKKDFKQIARSELKLVVPYDGDIITARKPNEYIENKVEIKGGIIVPGFYSLSSIKTVKDLINSANGFTRDAYKKNAILFRSNYGISDEVISLDLENDNDLNTSLKVLDIIEIPNINSLKIKKNISIGGYIKNPQKIIFNKNITLSDAVVIAGGFTEDANFNNIEVYRNVTEKNDITKAIKEVYSMSLDYKTEKPVYLFPNDIINITKRDFKSDLSLYFISGEVSVPGDRVLTNSGFTTRDLINEVKITKDASIENSYLVRDSLNTPIFKGSNNLEVLVVEGDSVVVPKKNNTIKLIGELNNEIIIPYYKNLSFKKAIQSAGGFLPSANKSKAYIISLNKNSKPIRKFLFFNINPKLSPGDSIIVPKKEDKEKASVAEILSITSGIASLVALIRIISQ